MRAARSLEGAAWSGLVQRGITMRADGWFGMHKQDVGVVWQQLAAHGALRAAGGGVQGLGAPIGRESRGFISHWRLCARPQVLNVGAVKDADQAGVGVLHCSIGERGGAANGERGAVGQPGCQRMRFPALSASSHPQQHHVAAARQLAMAVAAASVTHACQTPQR